MASDPNKLAGYLVSEISSEFGITNTDTLEKWAAAVSRAIDTYITTDVEVKAGIAVQVSTGTGSGATIGPGDLF
jgi:hypothetical protein